MQQKKRLTRELILLFCNRSKQRSIEDHFDANNELELMLRAKVSYIEMVRSIIPAGVECIFVRQAEQLDFAILCMSRLLGEIHLLCY